MKNVVFSAMLAVALMGSAASATAQTVTTAAAPEVPVAPQILLYEGLTMRAPQQCRSPEDNISFRVRSISQDRTSATVMVEARCWGNIWLKGGTYTGSLRVTGNAVTLSFSKGSGYGTEMTGTWQYENGIPVLRFGPATLGIQFKRIDTQEVVFR